MATTGPYIIYKSSLFCAAVRSNVDLEKTLRKRLGKVTFSFDGVDKLSTRLNFKRLTSAINVVCQQVREKRGMFLMNGRELSRRSEGLREQYYSDETDNNQGTCCDLMTGTSASDVCVLNPTGFVWDKERITDYELYRCKKDIRVGKKKRKKGDKLFQEEWEQFINQKFLEVWRRPVDSTGLYEYKVFGTFLDINAISFYRIQVDDEYRLIWDPFVLKLDVVDSDPVSGSEVLHWVTKFPYPLRSRDYVFVRRGKVDYNSMTMVLISRATTHPLCPDNDDYVRVPSYNSTMVILPHSGFDEVGFDFVLSYFDDPKTNFPSYCMNVLTSTNLPTFISTMHNAAAGLSQRKERRL